MSRKLWLLFIDSHLIFLVCGGVLQGVAGVIVSPGYPHKYPSNSVCKWEITAGSDEILLFEFEDLEIEEDSECSYDKLTIQEKDGVG